jgi:hypothetical protein
VQGGKGGKTALSRIHTQNTQAVPSPILTVRGLEEHTYSGQHLKQTWHRKIQNDRRLGTVVMFTYYKNNLGWILNNITSHGHIKQNRCQPW